MEKEMYMNIMSLELKIVETYFLLAHQTNEEERMKIKEKLEKLVKRETKILDDPLFLANMDVFLKIIEETVEIIPELIKIDPFLAKINHLVYLRTLKLTQRTLPFQNMNRLLSAFETDLKQNELLIIKQMIEEETDEKIKAELKEAYYSVICVNEHLEERFLKSPEVLDSKSFEHISLKKLYENDYPEFLLVKNNILFSRISSLVEQSLTEDNNENSYSKFIRLFEEIQLKSNLSYLSNEDYAFIRSMILDEISANKSLSSKKKERIKKLFNNKNFGTAKVIKVNFGDKAIVEKN